MAEDFLRDHPGMRPFVLSDVQLTGINIGGGAYGTVDEVAFSVAAAAKTIHPVLQGGLSKAASEFMRECQLMSTLRHPNIVQFLGVAFFPGSRLPALVMERLLTSLHDLLDPDMPPPREAVPPLAFFSMALKCSVLQDVARGLAYLHGQSPPIIHRDLSARNVLLNSGMVGKIADLGVARIAPHMRAAATMTKGPGALIYMPPEVFEEKSKYDASIDIFSLGVVTIFTVSETFPCDPLAPTYTDDKSGLLVARTELERRSEYMRSVDIKLRACGQLRADHPFIRLIQQCLHNLPAKRPVIHEVQRLLEKARACFGDGESEMNKRNLVRALPTPPRNQNLECVLRDLATENADLQSRNQTKDRELAEAQQQLREEVTNIAQMHSRLKQQLREKEEQLHYKEEQLQSSEREKVTVQQQLTRAEETIRREQQQLREKEEQMVNDADTHSRLLREKEEQLHYKEKQLQSSEKEKVTVQQQLTRAGETIRREQQQLREKEEQMANNAETHSRLLREKEEQMANDAEIHSRLQQELREKLTRKEAELTRAEETIRREQQQLREKEEELRSSEALVADLVADLKLQQIKETEAKDRELAEAQQQLREKEEQLRSNEALVADLLADLKLQQTTKSVPYTCHVSGPGLTSATVNHPTHIIVQLTDSSASPYPLTLNLTAQLELIIKATPNNPPQATRTSQSHSASLPVTMVSPSRYKVSYTAVSRGQHKLHVQVKNKEIDGSPFTVTVYLDPTQLGHPVRVVTDLYHPHGIAYNSQEEMIVSEYWGDRVSIRGQGKIRTFGSLGDGQHEMITYPTGIATDDADNIYVSSDHKLQKVTSRGEIIKCTGEKGKKEGEFDDPRGLTLYNNEVYVCDHNNHRIQIFDLDLNFVRSIGSRGKGRGQFDAPLDIKFDTAGNMYVAEWGNGKVQVMDRNGQFIREFGKDKLKGPSGLHIADKYVYVSDVSGQCIVVYETSGQFVSSFGRHGQNEGEFRCPYCITSCVDGYIHVCDWGNDRVQIF